MTPLRQRMLDAMSVRGFRPSTQQCYADAIYGLAKYYRGDPAQYSAQEIDAYLLHLVQERHLSYSSMNQAASAARFLYEKVLGHERAVFHIPMAKVPAKQPELLAREEIAHLFAACWRPTHRMLLQTVYATGLRVSEACALRVGDIDSHSDRRCIRVACGKGGKGRYTLLSATLLGLLRSYWQTCRPRSWLFCNASGEQALSAPASINATLKSFWKRCVKSAPVSAWSIKRSLTSMPLRPTTRPKLQPLSSFLPWCKTNSTSPLPGKRQPKLWPAVQQPTSRAWA